MRGKLTDLTGQKFERWTVLYKVPRKTKNRGAWWRCRCECGNESTVRTDSLRLGDSKSCGCYRADIFSMGGVGNRGSLAYFRCKIRSIQAASLKFGYTPLKLDGEEAKCLYEKNGGVCQICGWREDGDGRSLCLDHCHITGRFRGFLCHKCNKAIGLLGDNLTLVEKAVEYLDR